jgi:nitrogen fixation NifU-like protein
MAVIKYTSKVIEHFKHPHNVGELENPDGLATVGSPACGDQVSVYLKVEDGTIRDIKFLSYGCASNIATGSIVTDMAKGMNVEKAKKLTWKEAAEKLGGLPPVKVHCSVLAVDGLRAAIENYEERKLGIKHDKKLDESTLIKELKKIIYPKTGENIVDSKLIKYLKLNKDSVEIEVSLDETDEFKENVVEEIHEHLESKKGVEKVKVTIVEY